MSVLSFGQQRLWFLDQLEGPGAAYNVPIPLRLRGNLDVPALRAALTDVVARHEVLRTVVPVVDGTPGLRVLPDPVVPFEVAAGPLPEALVAAASRPFDLATEPPVRATLFPVGPDEHVLLVLLHHIAADGGSLGPLVRDLDTAYTARLAGHAPGWAPLDVQYADFALWQREVLGTEDDPGSLLNTQLAYWTDRLAGIPDRIPWPANGTGTGADIVEVDLPAASHERLIQVARAAGCTPFMGLQAAVSALLSRAGAGDDIVLGTPVAGRDEPALDDLVGFFVNTLVLRTDLAGDPGFAELLRRVRDTALDAYANQDVPFERIVDRLGVDRATEAHPLFQVMIVLQQDQAPPRLGDLDVTVEPLDLAAAKLDLSVVFAERPEGGVHCQLEYSADRFTRTYIEHLATTLVHLLDTALTDPTRPLSTLDLPAAPRPEGDLQDTEGPEGHLQGTQRPEGDLQGIPVGRGPRTAREQILCGLFADVLGVESVGIDDGFFALGGHSLLATRLIARIRTVLHVELGVRALFRAPTVAGIAAAIDKASGPVRPPLEPMPRPAELPLSFAQQRLWFLAGVQGQDRAYTIPLTLHLTGHVDTAALAEAIRDVVGRHESLRTVFPATDGQPRQHILPTPAEILTVTDDAQIDAPFDLANEIPLRANLFITSPTESTLVLCAHHIASDGASAGPLLRDLEQAYTARLAGHAPEWTPLPVQYADYTLWQRERLDLDAQVAHWTSVLTGLPDELALPYDRPRPATPTHAKGTVTAHLDAGTHTALRTLARTNQATLFMVVHAALATVLTRMGAGTDIPIGTPTAGRADEALDDLVGFFVNTLVLRVDTAGRPTFRQLLDRVRDTDLAAYANDDTPFERIVEELNPPRVLARHPLFQVMLSLTGGTGEPFALPGLDVRFADANQGAAKFDLNVTVDEHASGLDCWLEFAADLFDAATAQRLADALAHVLTAVAADPDRPIDRLPVLSDVDRERILLDWNDTGVPFPDVTLHELFAARAAETPDATALVVGPERVTYRELDERANRLAHDLRAAGVRCGHTVGVLLERNVGLVVAVLGALKAGAGYTMLDPELPAERIRELADQAGVTETVTADRFAGLAGYPATPPAVPGRPTDLACVMFTSGSTGRPKGILASHRSVVASVVGQSYVDFGPGEVWLQCSPVSWDAFALELFGPLLSGGTCVLQAGRRPEPAVIARLIVEHGVTTTYLSASLLNFLLDEYPDVFAGVRQVMTGGEAASVRHVGEMLRRHPHVRLVNGYGPVENMIFGSCHPLTPADTRGNSVPVGRSIANKRTYLLDAALQPVVPGVVGEVYMAGLGLADGYVGQPGLTAGRFVTSPFGEPGERMYRTGDLARWRADGVLEYLGRTDDQVKIRGFRVEPGEVRTALTRHDAVAQAAVVVREDRPGDKRLVAYLVPASEAFDLAEVRRHAAATLPEYLVPGAFVVLDALPRTANGKLDRPALPVPEQETVVEIVAPRTAREEILCGLFAEVLGIAEVGVRDGFFDLGGHSLLAAKLVSRVRTAFGAELGLTDLFANSTVEGVAAALDRAAETVRPPLVPARRPARLPLSPAQARLWFLNQLDGQGAGYAVPFALRLTGDLDRDALAAALRDVVGRHESLRTIFPEVDGEPCQLVLASWRPALTVVDTDPAGLDDALAAATSRGFDLATEAPVRTTLFATGPGEHVLLLLLHHIAVDGASMGPLVRDLRTAYAAHLAGDAPEWTPLPVQYADYTLWQRDLLDESLLGHLEHWHAELAGLPEELALPTDRPRPPVASHRGATVPLDVDPALHARLVDLARANHVTLFMVLQAALATLLTRMGAGTDIPIGTPVAGRADRALDDVVGFFVNTLVLRVDTAGEPTFAELLTRARDADLRAFEHQDVPFERLVHELNPSRSMARHPLFQVSLVLQNTEQAVLSLPGLAVAEHEVGTDTVKFDLGFGFDEVPTGGLRGSLAFATDLFDETTATELVDRFLRVLAAVAADPALRRRDIEVLDSAERAKILLDWNDTAVAVPATTLPALFAAQAARTPDTVAVVFEGTTLTYAELDARATHLARVLHAEGARPGRTVAVTIPRSLELIVALYAVHKAGAAYLPIDPGYPADRIEYMLADADPALVLTPSSIAELESRSGSGTLPVATPDDAAYVIYTSGSTGRPKGVVVPHAGIVNRLLWMQDEYRLDGTDRVLQKTASSFDVSVWEFFWPLLVGSTLVVAKPDGHKDPTYLADLIEAAGVTTVHFVPSMLDAFVGALEGERGRCVSLRRVICSGEALPTALAERFAVLFAADLDNLYGPTEASVDVTYHRFRADPTVSVPIGRPVWNTQVHVLDPSLRPVPRGVVGELYLAGDQLATGYLNRPGITSERFVPNPFRPAGHRMYRTGDLVRWCEDGVLEYLGRTDDQVKIRGLRIELGEITAAVAAHPSVAQAAVVVREDRPGDKRLVAYVVPNGVLDPAELRTAVGASLPEFMVPSAVVEIPELPLSPSGKLDRKSLPAPEFVSGGRAPRGRVEEILCGLFAEVLGLDSVSIDDSFFDLGGHSLLATRLVSRVRRELGVTVGIRTVFDAPTVAGMAARLGEDDDPLAVLLPLRREGSRAPLFCVHPAAGISWVYSGLLRHLPDRPIYGLQSPGLSEPGWSGGMAELVKDYVDEIRAVQPEGPYHLLGWSFGAQVAHAVAAQLQAEGERVELLAMLDGYPGTNSTPPDTDPTADLLASLGRESLDDLADLGERTLTALPGVFTHNRELSNAHRPTDTFHGDAVFFLATEGRDEHSPTPRMWHEHVTGRVEVHEVACRHGELTAPGPLARIAEVLNER